MTQSITNNEKIQKANSINSKFAKFLSNKAAVVSVSIIILFALSLIVTLPFAFTERMYGHDLAYHIDTIRALNEAWEQGTFGSKIYPLICGDYGYGTGLFYTMIPASFAVILMQILHIGARAAITIEVCILFFASALIMYGFGTRALKNKFYALFLAIIYLTFPYFLTNLYIRFAFSEIFMMLSIPMIFWGIWELVQNKNYKLFIPLFTLGYALAICCHLSLTVYVTIYVAIYLIINFKKFISEYRWVPFLFACLFVVLICAIYYIPMMLNFGLTGASSLSRTGGYLFDTAYNMFEPYLKHSALLMIVAYILFFIVHFSRSKEDRKAHKKFFILVSIYIGIMLPITPWYFFGFTPFNMVQFVWRLYSINAISIAFMLIYIFKYTNKKLFRYSLLVGCFLLLISNLAYTTSYRLTVGDWRSVDSYQISSNMSNFEGVGGGKNGDYYPTKDAAYREYIYGRLQDKLVIESNVEMIELANYQTINQLSFVVMESENGSVVLNLPYDKCEGLIVTEKQSYEPFETHELEIKNADGFVKLDIVDTDNETKIILNYANCDQLKTYLIENPVEFVVKEGNATISNFVKKNVSTYDVEILVDSNAVIELPTLFYKGYKLTYTTANGATVLEGVHNENGFIQIEVSESGKLHVEFEAKYISISNTISIVGMILFALSLILIFAMPRKYFTKMADWTTNFLRTHKTIAEILRFIIVGGIATLIDMLTMGITMYFMQRGIYSSFINVFIHAPTPSTLATIVGTTIGFLVGLVVNYLLSIWFVFNDKGKSKSAQGFLMFTVLSVIGLLINIVGTYIGFDLMHLNQWLVKIIMILIVLVYNYISKKLLLFKKSPAKAENFDAKTDNNNTVIEENKNTDKTDKNNTENKN